MFIKKNRDVSIEHKRTYKFMLDTKCDLDLKFGGVGV